MTEDWIEQIRKAVSHLPDAMAPEVLHFIGYLNYRHSLPWDTHDLSREKFICPLTGMEFLRPPSGSFVMGSNEYDDEKPMHKVEITGFWLGRFPVTQGEWMQIMGSNPSKFQLSDRHPVDNVSWYDVQEFIAKLNERTEVIYRLPTEAEWEYGCRSGTSSRYYFGNEDAAAQQYAWFALNANGSTHPVGEKLANSWGFHDMSGNVWEWVADWYGSEYYSQSPDSNPQGPDTGIDRITRGGGWYGGSVSLRPAFRRNIPPGTRRDGTGFRLAIT